MRAWLADLSAGRPAQTDVRAETVLGFHADEVELASTTLLVQGNLKGTQLAHLTPFTYLQRA